jgi:4-amino-4-deoxy-L-arabinose transferase-like glycosyltransferase
MIKFEECDLSAMAMSDSGETASCKKISWHSAAALLAVALLVRGGVLLALGDGLKDDPDGYRNIAEQVLLQGVFGRPVYPGLIRPSAYRPPLYPLLLANTASTFGGNKVTPIAVGALHLALGLATVWLTLVLAQSWGLGRGGIFAALLVTCDPILLNQSTLVMTETLATFLAVLGLFCLTRLSDARSPWYAGLAGGAIGLAILCRPTFLPWLIAAAAITPLLRTAWPRRAANLVAMLAVAAVVLAPWTIRNYQQFGRPILTTTHGGYTLLLANNPQFYRYLRAGRWDTVWDANELLRSFPPDYFPGSHARKVGGRAIHFTWDESSRMNELDRDRGAYALAFSHIRAEPGMFVYACVYRIGQLWSPLSHQLSPDVSLVRRLARYATALWYVAVFVLAVAGIYSLRRQALRTPWLWGLLLCLAFTVVHTFYWTNLRMRAPLMPVVCLLAAAGVSKLITGKSGTTSRAIEHTHAVISRD